MDTEYKQALSEVLEILNHTDISIIKKIPQNFLKFISENRDRDYKCNINFSNENWDDNIKEETKCIMALIYRDYIASPEERIKIIEEEAVEEKRQEQEIREKYNPDNLFKKTSNIIPEELKSETSLIEIKKEPWYKEIYKKILKLFGKR